MNAKDKAKLSTAIENYLQLKGLQDTQDEQMSGLKTVILDIAKKYPDDFEKGEFKVDGVGLLKYVNNPIKLVYTESGEVINDKDATNLQIDLDPLYCSIKSTLNLSRLKLSIENNDKAVLALLKRYKLKLNATQRLDIKPV